MSHPALSSSQSQRVGARPQRTGQAMLGFYAVRAREPYSTPSTQAGAFLHCLELAKPQMMLSLLAHLNPKCLVFKN